jgi:hypothetical protein
MKGDERGERREGVFRDELGELVGNAVGRGSRTSSDAFQGRRWKEWSIPDEGGFCITRSVTKGRRVEGNGEGSRRGVITSRVVLRFFV